MHYQSQILEMLQQRPEMYNQFRSTRSLLPAVESYASKLKASHETWKEELAQSRPGSDPTQIASEALELALKEMEDHLPSASPPNEDDLLSLDGAMDYLRRHMPRA
jgi:hypothetical protein